MLHCWPFVCHKGSLLCFGCLFVTKGPFFRLVITKGPPFGLAVVFVTKGPSLGMAFGLTIVFITNGPPFGLAFGLSVVFVTKGSPFGLAVFSSQRVPPFIWLSQKGLLSY